MVDVVSCTFPSLNRVCQKSKRLYDYRYKQRHFLEFLKNVLHFFPESFRIVHINEWRLRRGFRGSWPRDLEEVRGQTKIESGFIEVRTA